MSTSTAQHPKAIANNLGIGTRQTGAGDVDDMKVDDRGWQVPPPGEWIEVKSPSSRPTTPPLSQRPLKKSRWMPRPMQGPNLPTVEEKKVLIAEKREATRVAAFRRSLAKLAPPASPSQRVVSPTPAQTPAPSDSRTKSAISRIKNKRKTGTKRSPKAQAFAAATNFIRTVTKAEAAAPISVVSKDIELSNSFAPLDEPRRGTGAVIVMKEAGTTHLDNNAGRTTVVKYTSYRVVAVGFYGFFKSTLGSTFTPQSIGFHCAGEEMDILLPTGLVETLGAYLVGKIPNMETYLACQAYCRSLCRPIDFDTPRLMEDAAIYGPYIAMTSRCDEREAIVRKLQGSVYTKSAMKCLKIGALGGLALSMPVATAATAASAPMAVAGGLAFAACATVTVATALAVRAALHLFRPDEAKPVQHAVLRSSNSKAKAPKQHPDSKVRRLQLEKKAPDATRADAARVTGIAVAGHAPTIFAKNQDNTVAALEKRSAAEPPPFAPADRTAFVDWFLKHWPTLVSHWMRLNVPSDPDEWLAYVNEWIDGCGSSTQAKAKYRETALALHALGITSHSRLTPQQIYLWTKREASVKNETVLKAKDKSPRQILAATPEFVVLTAPFVKQLTGLVRRKWGRHNKIVYAPGHSAKHIAESMTQEEWEMMANVDFNGYDSAQGVTIGEMERTICSRHAAPNAMLQLMQGNFETHGVSREGVKFETPYVRNSGDPWTTLFNTVLNGALMSYVYCRDRECDPRDMRVKFFAGGDDGALFYDGAQVDFSTELGKLGFPATVKHVAHLHEVEFLSCRLTATSTGWNLIPMVGKIIAKLGYSVRATTPKIAKAIALGAAQSLYASSSGCPPLRAYLDAVIHVCSGVTPIKPRDEEWKLTTQYTGEPTAQTWAQLWDIYGWSPALQEALVLRLSTVHDAGVVISSPALELLCDRDTGRSDYLFWRPAEEDVKPASCWDKDLTTEGIEPNPGWGFTAVAAAAAVVPDLYSMARAAGYVLVPEVSTPPNTPASPPDPTPLELPPPSDYSVPEDEKDCDSADFRPMSDQDFRVLEDCVLVTKYVICNGESVPSYVPLGSTCLTVFCGVIILPPAALDRLQPFQCGRPCSWHDTMVDEFLVVRAKGLGGATISRSEAILEKIENRVGVLPTSRPWLIGRLDPMHDNSIRLGGMPDSNCGMSVPMLFKTSLNVNSLQGSTANWDMNVVFYPEALPAPAVTSTRYINSGLPTNILRILNSSPGAGVVGGICTYQGVAGATLNTTNFTSGVPYIPSNTVGTNLYTSAISGGWRLNGLGLEVVNTTAPLYRSGAVTVWTQPVPPPQEAGTFSVVNEPTLATTYYPGAMDFVIGPAPPFSIAEANVLGGSRQWAAEEGCYMVARPTSDTVPVLNGQQIGCLYYEDASTDVGIIIAGTNTTALDGGAYSITSMCQTSFNPYQQMGAYFTGLTAQSTFTINVWSFIEIFPEQLTNVLTPLAQPSAPYDEQALRLYSELIKSMPVGVMLKENGLGDWLADMASKAVSFVGNVAGMVTRGANAVTAGVNSWNSSEPSGQGTSPGSTSLARGPTAPLAPIVEVVREQRVRPPRQLLPSRIPVNSQVQMSTANARRLLANAQSQLSNRRSRIPQLKR